MKRSIRAAAVSLAALTVFGIFLSECGLGREPSRKTFKGV
ncbi:hypothetical protein IMSAGC013_02474 [Lachnospiraceae bacterium]|nr:hypothetical protein IMSAGC013_02474 [Lachnospiraceae bacterium]